MKWFITLFANLAPLDTVDSDSQQFLWIWNRILSHGLSSLLEMALGLIISLETKVSAAILRLRS